MYGEDSLDPTKEKFFGKIDFIQGNYDAFKTKFKYKDFKKDLKTSQIFKFKESELSKNNAVLDKYPPGINVGTMSDKCCEILKSNKKEKEFNEVYALKYMYGLIHPGESVGCTAAQSIG